jgi:hypothetical protein
VLRKKSRAWELDSLCLTFYTVLFVLRDSERGYESTMTSELSSLSGVVVVNEQELQKQILARAEARGATGVATAASIAAIASVQAETAAALAALESAADLESSVDAMNRRDKLRMRMQLLTRLSQLRKITHATSCTLSAVPDGSQNVRHRHEASIEPRDTGEAVLAALTASSSLGEYGRREAVPAPAARPPEQGRRILHRISASKGAASSHKSRVKGDRSGPSSAPALPRAAQAVAASDLPRCPLCQRVLSDLDVGGIDRHVERCLRRQQQQQPTIDSPSGTASNLTTPAPTGAQKGAAGDSDSLFDSEQSSDSEDMRGSGDSGSATSSPRLGSASSDLRGVERGDPPAAPLKAVKLSRADRASNVVVDDWSDAFYEARLAAAEEEESDVDDEDSNAAVAALTDTSASNSAAAMQPRAQRIVNLSNGLQLPRRIARALLPYQQTGVQWMYELHRRSVGGILGDEMGEEA